MEYLIFLHETKFELAIRKNNNRSQIETIGHFKIDSLNEIVSDLKDAGNEINIVKL